MDPDFYWRPHEDSHTLVVAFTSYGSDGAPPVGAEWVGVLSRLPVQRLYLVDRRQLWYLSGVEGLGDGLEGIAEGVLRHARECGAERIFTLGASMGAFGALLVGKLIGAQLAITFSAIASGSVDRFIRNDDARCRHKLQEIHDRGLAREILSGEDVCPFVNYYDPDAKLEQVQADLLAPIGHGELIEMPGSGHNTAEYLARRGLLMPLIEEELFPQPGRWAALMARLPPRPSAGEMAA